MEVKDKGLERLISAVLENDKRGAQNISSELLERGMDPLKIVNEGLSEGMNQIGDKFEKLDIYLPELMAAADTFTAAMEILEPEITKKGEEYKSEGTIVIGTVEGDIHSIGKDIVGMLFKTAGFQVYDLGVDVKSSTFLRKAQEVQADIIGLSSLLTTTKAAQKDVIQMLYESESRNDFLVLVGGAPVNQKWANEVGADGYAETASGAVKMAKKLMNDENFNVGG